MAGKRGAHFFAARSFVVNSKSNATAGSMRCCSQAGGGESSGDEFLVARSPNARSRHGPRSNADLDLDQV